MPTTKSKAADDWDKRVRTNPFLWMAEFVSSVEDLRDSGARDLESLLATIPEATVTSARMLDVGCGIGRLTAVAKDKVAAIVAADISDAALQYAQTVVGEASSVSYFKLNGKDLAGLSGPFDIIISFATLCHLTPQVLLSYLSGCHELVAADGYVILQLYVGTEHTFSEEDSFSIRSYNKERLLHCLEEIGFVIEDFRELALPFDGSDHVFNRHPIVVTLRKTDRKSSLLSPNLLIENSPLESNSDKVPRDEEGLVLREVNSYLARHDLLSAQKLLEYWVTSNPSCQQELMDTLRFINESLEEH